MTNVKQTREEKTFLSSVTTFDGSDIELNKLLERYGKYILELVRMQVPRNIVPPSELADEINDLTQMALIVLWQKLISEKIQITSPNAYIRYIVRSQCIDLIRRRQRKPISSVSIDQDGELRQGSAMLMQSEGLHDPAFEYDRKELIVEIIDDVMKLPPHQRLAMICLLKDEVGNTFPLVETFRKHGIDIETIDWPQDPTELHRLKSSISFARKKLNSPKKKYVFA